MDGQVRMVKAFFLGGNKRRVMMRVDDILLNG